MMLNLPQTLYDLNHHHRAPSSSSARILHPLPRRRFLGLVATCRTYRGILPHLIVLATFSYPRTPRTPLLFIPAFPRHSFLAPFDDPLEIYCLPSPVPCSPFPHTARIFPCSVSPLPPFVRPPSLPRTRCNSKPANFDLYPHQRRCTYAGYDLIRRR